MTYPDDAAYQIERVRAACAAAQQADATTEGITAARRLLVATREPLLALSTMPGQEVSTRTCRNEVAAIVDACAVGYAPTHQVDKRVGALLAEARSMATATSIINRIDRHIAAQRETKSGGHVGSDRWADHEDRSWPTEGSDVPGFFGFMWNEFGRGSVFFAIGAVVLGGLAGAISNGHALWIALAAVAGGFITGVAGTAVVRLRADRRTHEHDVP